MPKIPIIPTAKKPMVPPARDLSREVPRFKPSGRPPLPLEKSYNRQGTK